MQFEVVHRIPGRARLRIPGLRADNGGEASLRRWLTVITDISGFRLNPFCSSAIIYYDGNSLAAFERFELALWAADWQAIEAAPAHAPSSENGVAKLGLAVLLKGPATPFLWSTVGLGICLLSVPIVSAVSLPLLVYTAIPTLRRAFKIVRDERRLNVDFLDSVAVIVSLGRGEFITAAFLTWMISLGDWIRDHTAAKSKRAITDLIEFHTANAWVLVGHKVIRKPVSAVNVDDNVIVYPGEIILWTARFSGVKP